MSAFSFLIDGGGISPKLSGIMILNLDMQPCITSPSYLQRHSVFNKLADLLMMTFAPSAPIHTWYIISPSTVPPASLTQN
ncbi:hypothetical protein BGAL_0050g00280 [Botrytis galanthina]|uniref:Uncharacterized protein n=1 Tax=Botrytis galanthina TaxID=278940 RepID=A0A4S8R8B0_9HELO|nr:hypothetical protein BGAL_0050g00280 [Botrytis galanthina]